MIARSLIAALALLLVANPVAAWNAGGHRLAAGIAWDSLAPAEQAWLWEILRSHPDFPHWHSPRRAAMDAALARGDRVAVFAEAGNWADSIRDAEGFVDGDQASPPHASPGVPDRLRHQDWHYVNQPLGEPADSILGGRLHEALPALFATLADRHSPQRAYALVWLLHLVADLHQPLHVATRRLAGGRHDAGGNAVEVRIDPALLPKRRRVGGLSLHAYWDDLVAPPWLSGAGLDSRRRRLMTEQPGPTTAGEPTGWRSEAHQLARQAYGSLLLGGRIAAIDEATHRANQRIAERQIALAGYRLAKLLRQAIAGAPESGEHRPRGKRRAGEEIPRRQSLPARPLQ
jgi:hypothetical protein